MEITIVTITDLAEHVEPGTVVDGQLPVKLPEVLSREEQRDPSRQDRNAAQDQCHGLLAT